MTKPNQVQPKFFENFDVIDEIIAQAPNAEKFREKIVPVLKEDLIAEYFYDSLPTGAWLKFVQDERYLSITPDSPRLAAAAILRYLTRVCAEKIELPDTELVIQDDAWVMQAFLTFLSVVPARQAAGYVEQIVGKRTALVDWQNFRKLGELAVKFAQSKDDVSAALMVSFVIGDLSENVGVFDLEAFLEGPLIQVLHHVKDPLRITNILAKTLSELLGIREANKPNDYSYIWRPAIEEHEQNIQSGREDYIISALRDSASWCITECGLAKEIIEQFAEFKWLLFQRLSIFLSSIIVDPSNIWRDYLFDAQLIFSTTVWHEYSLLLSAKFSMLSIEERKKWLDLIFSSLRKASSPNQDHIYLRDRLTLIRNELIDPVASELKELERELGEAVHPEFRRFSTTLTFSGSDPLDLELISEEQALELAKNDRLDKFLSSEDPRATVLINHLPAWVADDPDPYLAFCNRNQDLVSPELGVAVLSGLNTSIRTGQKFDVSVALSLCERSLKVSKKTVASFLFDLLSSNSKNLVPSQKDVLWRLISFLCRESEDPAPSYETNPRTNVSVSINSTRGQALHAAFYYVFWLKASALLEDSDSQSFYALVRERLDTAQEKSCSVRSVCGEWLPWLVELDRKWVLEHLAHFFPSGAFGDAVWFVYLDRNRVFKITFEVLLTQYAASIKQFRDDPPQSNVAHRLAEHLIFAHFFSFFSQIEGSVIEEFFQVSVGELRRHAVRYLASICTADFAKEEQLLRARQLWESCWKIQDKETMPAVGNLFTAKNLGAEWLLEQLEFVLKEGVLPDEPGFVLTELASFASDAMLGRVLRASKQIAILQPEKWRLYRQESDFRKIVLSGLSSSDKDVQNFATELIHLLGSFGLLSLRDVLPRR